MKNPIRSKEEQIRKQEADIAKKTHEKALLEQPLSQTPIDFTSNSLYTVRPCQGGGGGGGAPRSLVGILKCLVSAFCQGFTSLSEIERHAFVLVGILVK